MLAAPLRPDRPALQSFSVPQGDHTPSTVPSRPDSPRPAGRTSAHELRRAQLVIWAGAPPAESFTSPHSNDTENVQPDRTDENGIYERAASTRWISRKPSFWTPPPLPRGSTHSDWTQFHLRASERTNMVKAIPPHASFSATAGAGSGLARAVSHRYRRSPSMALLRPDSTRSSLQSSSPSRNAQRASHEKSLSQAEIDRIARFDSDLIHGLGATEVTELPGDTLPHLSDTHNVTSFHSSERLTD